MNPDQILDGLNDACVEISDKGTAPEDIIRALKSIMAIMND